MVLRINAHVSFEGLLLSGAWFTRPVSLSEYAHVLGTPSRTVEPPTAAPYGHRNNQIHMFDDVGIYVIEHHASRLVGSIAFIYEPSECPFPPETGFTGRLVVGGATLHPLMSVQECVEQAGMDFKPFLGGSWSTRRGGVYVSLECGRATRAKPIPDKQLITHVYVGLLGAELTAG